MKKVLLIATLFVFSFVSAQTTVGGVTLNKNISIENTNSSLDGYGIRKKLGFKLYVAGLYTTKNYTSASQIVGSNDPMAIQLNITSKLLTQKKMSAAIRDGFKKSAGSDFIKISKRVEQMIQVFSKEPIVVGDVFDIKYASETGTKIYKNGKLATTVKGLDFKKYLFGMWLGDKPVDKNLKASLLK